ncbi:hypothetical protein NDU88_007433 [Pleurodeles waltl]|uniref:Uncharacterized protein n=1 Tax=Pleurodeles waltl TaxID=8319 RepID=A0AAV7N217_PLEWA|nr:hypothetical protein NDU88_007433 [Pleurodeles waltl]
MDSAATPDPEVQRAPANPCSRPGIERQREPFHAVTWLINSEGSDEERSTEEWRTRSCGNAKEDGDDKEGGGFPTTNGPTGDHTDDWKTRITGTGGAQRKLRPRLGKIMAPSCAWPS